MKRLPLKLGIYLCLLFGLWGCAGLGLRKARPQPEPPASAANLLEQWLEQARADAEAGDYEAADSLYMAVLDSLNRAPEDSTVSALRRKLVQFYQENGFFLSRPPVDSLSPEAVLDQLDSLATETESPADTNSVAIEDVFSPQHQMRIPLVLNRQVQNALRYFTRTRRGRRVFQRWLQRAGRYERLIKSILREEGVPEDLFYLAMIESGFVPHARSYARAVGIWQFISSTGRAYGLRHNWWFDERRDPVKSTRAAARHLKDLYERFGDWYLAMAGYNYNPRKIERRLHRYKVDSYWELPRLPRQTRNYVPTFIAAATIARNPEQFGFQVQPEPPLEFDTVTVRECVDLNVVARCVDSDFATIKALNPALLRWCTPPTEESWTLYIPKGTREKFLRNYAKIPDDQKLTYIHHRIRYGETLSTIARRYGVSMAEIRRQNHLRGNLIRAGHYLVIPVPQNRKAYRKYARRASYSPRPVYRKPVSNVPGRVKHVYRVKSGDTLWDVARRYGVSVRQLRRWNGLGYSRIIRPGQVLNIWLKPDQSAPALAEAQPEGGPLVGTGVRLGKNEPEAASTGSKQVHIVRRGDTLWDIAQRYGVSIRQLKLWNHKRTNTIRPGEKLYIYP
ncbi:MAG: LysM peptidoglycan-binding domain-containing protein [Calditrichaeota bacterium]|nr:MAG: LysM peptidoglycan-binding domain-containing protein [Calditrichota bacterium]